MGNVIVRVPHQSAYVVEFLGRYWKSLDPGLHFLIPFFQRIIHKHSLKEQTFTIHAQNAVTKDNVHLQIEGVLYLKIEDPYKCSYGAVDPLQYSYVLAQSIMRSEIGKISLDKTFEEREALNANILESLTQATEPWGIKCLRYEIKDIKLSESLKKIMNLEAEAERQKRAEILKSEGKKMSDINIAEGQKRSKILIAEAGAEQYILNGRAIANRIRLLNMIIGEESGKAATNYNLADLYTQALEGLSDEKKMLILNANMTDPSKVFENLLGEKPQKALEDQSTQEGAETQSNQSHTSS